MNLFRRQIEDRTIAIRDEQFAERVARVVPTLDSEDLTFNNTGKAFFATVLYIDIRHSSELLDAHRYANVAKLLSAYYNAIVRIANQDGGEIRSFNGDSLLVFFMGTEGETITKAIRSAMKMKFAITRIVNPVMKGLSNLDFGIGIDYGKVLAKKVGIRSSVNKDLIWIGNGVNRATKISDRCKEPYNIGISEKIFKKLDDGMYHTSDVKGNIIPIWNRNSFLYNGEVEKVYKTSCYIEF